MLALIGIAMVFAAVFGGYVLEKGNPCVLMQPAEMLIICGAALGTVLVANPPSAIRKMAAGLVATFRAAPLSERAFRDHLLMLYEILTFARRAGINELERDFDDPAKSRIFSHYPAFLANRPVCDFVCDTLRMMVVGESKPHELDRLMDLDMDVQRRGHQQPVAALAAVADCLPGLGIVAAVLGVVLTMESIGGPATQVGRKIAAALVGTFLGILVSYGFIGPIAAAMSHAANEEGRAFEVVKMALVASVRGYVPAVAIEFARKLLMSDVRPTFSDLEAQLKNKGKAAPAAGKAA